MSRRSTRLLSGGYYHSDEESDSSSVTTISYRENPVKVFKKKSGRKRRNGAEESPGTSTGRAGHAEQSPSPSPSSSMGRAGADAEESPSPSPGSSAGRVGPGTEESPSPSFSKGKAAALINAPSSDWSAVPRRALRSPEPSPLSRPALHFQLQEKAAPNAVDSSGYSSSEEPCKRPCSRETVESAGPWKVSREWQRLKDAVTAAVSRAVEAVQSNSKRVIQLVHSRSPQTPVTGASWSSARMKRLVSGLLFLLIFFALWWTSLLSGLSIRTGPSLTAPAQSAGSPLTALDAATVSAAVEKKMQHFQREMLLQHSRLVAEVKQQMQMDIEALKQSSSYQEEREQTETRVEKRLSEVQSYLQTLHSHSESATASLLLRIAALEDQVSRDEPRVNPRQPLQFTPELEQALASWLTQRLQEQAAAQVETCRTCERPLADTMADFALESQGASVVSTRCSETYRTRSACVTLFGLPLWYPSESPRTVIQGPAVLLPGKCWAFHGVQGTLVIALSHPIRISHVTLDHLPRHSSPTGRIQSAPKDFQVYGISNETEEGTLLGTFRYNEDGPPTQTFSLYGLTDVEYRLVELRVLSNWGHVQYTCVYRFRVHGQMSIIEE